MESLKQHPTYGQALEVINTLKSAGHAVYFAGGCVRDGLLGRHPQDLDLATSATPDEVHLLFPKALGIGKAFGIMMLPLGPHQKLEIATFRKDGEYQDGRRPQTVEFSNPEEDAKRRDFTVNALFFDPERALVIDFVNGQEDLEKKILRTVGDPATRFGEDQLRLLRAVRFISQLDFEIEKETHRQIQALAPFVVKVAQERILEELQKLLAGTYLLKGLTELLETNLWPVLFQHWFSREAETWTKDQQFDVLDLVCEMNAPRSRFYWLLRSSGFTAKDSVHTLKCSHAWLEAFQLWVSLEEHITVSPSKSWSMFLKWYRTDLNADFRVWLLRQSLKPVAAEILKKFDHFDQLPEDFDQPIVKSGDVVALGGSPGPQMGKILKEAHEVQLRLWIELNRAPSKAEILSHCETRAF
ncbi:MAG: hypothetical protein K2X47_05890 [Bdellovibrionales bacterium]|nr:hypothetical protein [Bdellovibrionales bacterium]